MKCVVLCANRGGDECAGCNCTLLGCLIPEKTLDRFCGELDREVAGGVVFSSRNRSFAYCDRFEARERFESFASSIRAHSAKQSDENTGCRNDAQHCEECVS